MTDIAGYAEIVDEAARTAKAIPQFTEAARLSVTEAYQIQARSIDRRIGRGEKLVGVKMGLTSRAKMAQVDVHEVIWGRLTSGMRLEEGGALSRARYVHPRIEPEIAYLLKEPLSGEISPVEALRAGKPLSDPGLEAVRRLTQAMVAGRGWVDDKEIDAFLAAGHTRRNVLDVVLGVGMKTLSNYTNHIAHTPLDPAWKEQEWSR